MRGGAGERPPRYAECVTARRDDDALTWDGDDDPTLDTGAPASPTAPTLPDGYTAVGKDADTVALAGEDVVAVSEPRAPMSNAVLIVLGILGGFYLIFTVGWVIGGLRLQGAAQYLVTDVMFQGSFWLAVLAPALWFGTVLFLTRGSAAWVRILWLVAGAILLVPWPFIMVGAIGQ